MCYKIRRKIQASIVKLDIRSCLLCLRAVCNSLAASAVSFSHNAGKYDKDEEADDEIQGKD